IYTAGRLGARFREALCRASQRGLRVRVLVDALGSYALPASFWRPLIEAGGEARFFNPLSFNRLGIRNHRKMLACDGRIAFVGGFNISSEYEGDGITSGWCDLGLELEGALAPQLAASFEEMFERADFRHRPFIQLRRSRAKRTVTGNHEQLLLSGPGRGPNPIKRALFHDLASAHSVKIMVAYFLPTWRLRRQLGRVVRRGGQVQLILPGKSDVAVSRLAGQSLYRRLLRDGVQIFEYQPQILHAKLIIADGVVYVGSANLDPRSLNINYELMLRFEHPEMARQAREAFQRNLENSRQILPREWRDSRSLWRRFKQHWAYFLLVRIDPYIARRQWRALSD
ncbi:MAG: phospholipase D-like domain-containing protein, partial [Limisphaerales bacterium]